MAAVAGLPGAAIGVSAAPASVRRAAVGLGAVFPAIALVVYCAEALLCHASVGWQVTSCPCPVAVVIVYAVSLLRKAVMGLQIADLPGVAIAIHVASPLHQVASFADDFALFPGITVCV